MNQNFLATKIGILGMGRMSVGLAIDFALKGIKVDLIDLKSRTEAERRKYRQKLDQECGDVLDILEMDSEYFSMPEYRDTPSPFVYDLVFEGLPEEIALKQASYRQIRNCLGDNSLLCSMTSTFPIKELSRGIEAPLNILVTHFMNPPYLIPFLEVVAPPDVDPALVEKLFAFLQQVGHMPIRCKSSPGFVISRLQLGLMNEAVRIMEEGVASAEDIDKAILYGWGYRFPVIGILEFIDSGGLDILFHAGRSVSRELKRPDLACPKRIDELFAEGAVGTRTLRGIFAYPNQQEVNRQIREKLKKQARLKSCLDQIHRCEKGRQ